MALKKFRKKPIIVQAEQWFPGESVEGVDENYDPNPTGRDEPYPVVFTPNGPVIIEPGEWIITGVEGEKYPCKQSVFEATYEPIDEADDSAARELDRVREVIRELVEGSPIVQPERVAEWLAVFIATSRDFDRERAERVRQLTIDLAEARRHAPQAPLEVVQVSVVGVVDAKFSEHDDG